MPRIKYEPELFDKLREIELESLSKGMNLTDTYRDISEKYHIPLYSVRYRLGKRRNEGYWDDLFAKYKVKGQLDIESLKSLNLPRSAKWYLHRLDRDIQEKGDQSLAHLCLNYKDYSILQYHKIDTIQKAQNFSSIYKEVAKKLEEYVVSST